MHRADRPFTAGGVSVAAGDYIVRLDQPYGPLAKSYFSRQDFGADDPRPYDDTGWTLQYVRNVALHPIADTSIFHGPMTKLDDEVRVRGRVSRVKSARAYLIAPTTETGLIQFRYALRDLRMYASEDTFRAEKRVYGRGTTIIAATGDLTDVERRIPQAAESLGLTVTAARALPAVARHELDLPRIGLVHSWLRTQDEGWVRFAFDNIAIPYTSSMCSSSRTANC